MQVPKPTQTLQAPKTTRTKRRALFCDAWPVTFPSIWIVFAAQTVLHSALLVMLALRSALLVLHSALLVLHPALLVTPELSVGLVLHFAPLLSSELSVGPVLHFALLAEHTVLVGPLPVDPGPRTFSQWHSVSPHVPVHHRMMLQQGCYL